MNLSISEKEVDYRINNQYKKKRSIGEYIRKERLAQGLKQELVCKGVCSVSYFSRIESNKVNPPEIYITKIFERLNKPIPENLDIENYYKENINNFISAIEYKNDRLVDEEYNKILNIPDINKDLYEFVYLIYYKKINDLEPLLLKLHQQQVHFDNDELLLYLENVGSYYVIKNEYENAMRCISISLKLQDYLGIKKPSILYKYAWILGKYNNDYQCLKYAEEAERLYSNQNNIYRSLQSKLLIGIKLSKYFPERAIELYQNCIRITNHSNYRGLIKVIKYNLAMVYKKCNNYVKSEKLFNELISTYSDDNNYVFDVFV
ncbi:MAG TPA: helix-turn-helix domain-containing protein, partial [Haloplasmataceae bacterium]